MKAVIALVLALALLAIGIPLSRAISDGEEHTITRTREPVQDGDTSTAKAGSVAAGKAATSASRTAAPQPAAATQH